MIGFVHTLRNEFISMDYVRGAKDKIRRLSQKIFVSAYRNEFCNKTFSIPDMNAEDEWEKCIEELKFETGKEISMVRTLEEASKIDLNANSAIFGSTCLQLRYYGS